MTGDLPAELPAALAAAAAPKVNLDMAVTVGGL